MFTPPPFPAASLVWLASAVTQPALPPYIFIYTYIYIHTHTHTATYLQMLADTYASSTFFCSCALPAGGRDGPTHAP